MPPSTASSAASPSAVAQSYMEAFAAAEVAAQEKLDLSERRLYGGDAAKALPAVIKLGAQFITSASEWNLMMAAGIERVKALRALTP